MTDNQLLIVGLVLFGLIYFLPTVIAFNRGHHYRWVILALNSFAAWTGLIWIAVLVWAIWPSERSLADPLLGNPTGVGRRNVGDTLGAVDYGRQRGFDDERRRG